MHESIYDEFCKKAAARAAKRVVGDPFAEGVEQGPQVDEGERRSLSCVLRLSWSAECTTLVLLFGSCSPPRAAPPA